MKRPYLSAIAPLSGDDAARAPEAFLDGTGQNTGNLIFSAALRRLVRGESFEVATPADFERLRATCDGVVIAAANWLQPARDFGEMAALIESLDMPAVLVGLGAQSQDGRIPELPAGTRRLIAVVSERSAAISVRGAFSAEVLDHYGIHNVAVTGCPSLLYHLDRPAAVTRSLPEGALRLGMNGLVPGDRVPERETPRMALGRFMLDQAQALGADYVCQTELPLIRLAQGAPRDADGPFLAHVLGTADRAALARYGAEHLRVFGNAPDWIDWARGRDMVIGTRLHGVIAALLAGTPAVLLTHDSRTAEMARQAALPACPAETVLRAGRIDPRALWDQADPAGFNTRQRAYFDAFTAFFDRVGIPHRLTPHKPPH
jgi:hypothetical protein